MKKLKTILLFLVICISCFAQNRTRTNTNTTANTKTTNQKVIWEYEVVKVENYWSRNDTYRAPEFIANQTDMLNRMGNEGWELVNVYTEIATAFPNFGKSDYVNGIRSNIRTTVVNFVFKRPKIEI